MGCVNKRFVPLFQKCFPLYFKSNLLYISRVISSIFQEYSLPTLFLSDKSHYLFLYDKSFYFPLDGREFPSFIMSIQFSSILQESPSYNMSNDPSLKHKTYLRAKLVLQQFYFLLEVPIET